MTSRFLLFILLAIQKSKVNLLLIPGPEVSDFVDNLLHIVPFPWTFGMEKCQCHVYCFAAHAILAELTGFFYRHVLVVI